MPYPILMIDRYGTKLNPEYSWISRRLEHHGLARLIHVSRLVAEDKSKERIEDEHEKLLYRLIEDYGEVASGELYKAYHSHESWKRSFCQKVY